MHRDKYLNPTFVCLKVTNFKSNDKPEKASRPMSASAAGFVPSGGAGALVLESLESALGRGAKIYAEILGGDINSGGQRNGGTMTASNAKAVQRCIKGALKNAAVAPQDIDLINGHLTATTNDPKEIQNWAMALKRNGKDFPYIHSLKSMIGHGLAASGAIECVAAILSLHNDFIFPSINCEDVHPDIASLIDVTKIPQKTIENTNLQVIAKASFGFGDVNACVIFKKFVID